MIRAAQPGLHLDLDGFSTVKDGLGHHAGDRLLDVVARRLESMVTDQQAMVARLGTDEYAILIEPGDSAPDVGALVEIINTKLAEPFYTDGIGVAVTATIGVAQRRVGGSTPEELMRAAGAGCVAGASGSGICSTRTSTPPNARSSGWPRRCPPPWRLASFTEWGARWALRLRWRRNWAVGALYGGPVSGDASYRSHRHSRIRTGRGLGRGAPR